ncbi:hypothetical protein O1611_g7808 [Lasiodiplodia mahajangana]|uniref:Uncharacterized protein n=1 Tax=Lasiodiplodia mahajangana TaxID=1108764 RepID=A0ACC2JEH1_9PEZI|nr:hypothetical protein O1611_g7808 [Lasiodiplodia mahajangana]
MAATDRAPITPKLQGQCLRYQLPGLPLYSTPALPSPYAASPRNRPLVMTEAKPNEGSSNEHLHSVDGSSLPRHTDDAASHTASACETGNGASHGTETSATIETSKDGAGVDKEAGDKNEGGNGGDEEEGEAEAENEDEDDDNDEDEDEEEEEEEEDEEDEEDDEPRLKYARLTQHLLPVYRNGDSTSAFLVAGDKMIVGTHKGNIVIHPKYHSVSLLRPGLQC